MNFFNLDFIRPNWKKSDPIVRANAVEKELDDQEVLESLALSDSDANVRLAAVRKLTSLETLQKISKNDSEDRVRRLAANRYIDEIVKILKNATNPSEKELAQVVEIKDTRYAEDLLKSPVTSDIVRKELVKHCNKSSILAAVAMGDANEEIALDAARKVTSEHLMSELAKMSKHMSVRQLVAEKTRAKNAKKAADDEGKEAAARVDSMREALLVQAHGFAANKNPLSVKSLFEDLMKNAAALGMGDKQAELDEVYGSFNKFCDDINAEKFAAEKAEAEKQAKIESLAKELEELEQIVSDNKVQESEERVNAIMADWNDGKSLMEAGLVKRFNNVFFKIQESKKPVAEASEDAPAEAAARPALLERLQALSETDVNESTGKFLHTIIREWENPSLPALEGDDPILRAYNALRNTLSEKIAAFNENSQKLVEENSVKLKAIIEKVKALDENEDFDEIHKKLRDFYNQWKEIVGEQKFKYHDLWNEYKEATSRFQEMQQWESWHNEKDREDILLEMDALTKEEASQAVLNKLRDISKRWKEVGHVSAEKYQVMQEHFQADYEKIKANCASFIEEMNAERVKNLADKEALCQKIEELVANTEIFWKDKFKTMQELQENWKNIGMVPKENVAALTERFKAAVNSFYAQHKENLKAEDATREANYEKKVALCVEAEALVESTDWNATSTKLKQLQDNWKAAGPVPKSKSDEIWTRFRSACDSFFEKKRAHFEEMDASKQKNLDAKNALCEKIEAAESTLTLDELKALEAEYKTIGMVPKESIETINNRYSAVFNKVLARLALADTALAAELEKVKAKKLEMIDKVRMFAESAGSNQLADAVRETQKEWREIGSCGAEEQELYKTFREVCDDFFTRRRDQLDIQEQARQNNLQKKLLLCEQAEDLLTDLSDATVVASMNKVKHLRRLWKEVGAVPREQSEKTWNRFNTACDKVFAFGRKDEPKAAAPAAPATDAPAAENA